jgi:hypothetical protein
VGVGGGGWVGGRKKTRARGLFASVTKINGIVLGKRGHQEGKAALKIFMESNESRGCRRNLGKSVGLVKQEVISEDDLRGDGDGDVGPPRRRHRACESGSSSLPWNARRRFAVQRNL